MTTYYDTFVGLASGTAIASAAWDAGSISWSSSGTTPMVGKGSDEVGGPTSPTSTALGNFTAPADAEGYAVFFRTLTGRDTTIDTLQMYVEGTGPAATTADSNSIKFALGGFNDFSMTELNGGTATNSSYVLTTGNSYCMEVLRTSSTGYTANLYAASGGVRGALLKTISLTAAHAQSTSRRLVQLLCPTGNQPYVRISRVEVLAPDVSVTGTASWTEANDTAAGSGSLTVSGTSATTEANDTASGIGTVGNVVNGTGAWTEANDTASASGSLSVSGTSATTEANDAASGSGTVASGGTFIAGPIMNNTETIMANQAVYWTWTASGRIGAMSGKTVTDGTGTTASDGRLTVTGLSAGSGILMVARRVTSAADDDVYYQAGTVS